MEERPYSVAQNEHGRWVVSADGQQILECSRRSDALRTTKEASELLEQSASTSQAP
jgi:hypothetical protein